jgi:hypothetical protein
VPDSSIGKKLSLGKQQSEKRKYWYVLKRMSSCNERQSIWSNFKMSYLGLSRKQKCLWRYSFTEFHFVFKHINTSFSSIVVFLEIAFAQCLNLAPPGALIPFSVLRHSRIKLYFSLSRFELGRFRMKTLTKYFSRQLRLTCNTSHNSQPKECS